MSEKVPTYLTTKEVLAHLRIGRDALRSLQADAEQYQVFTPCIDIAKGSRVIYKWGTGRTNPYREIDRWVQTIAEQRKGHNRRYPNGYKPSSPKPSANSKPQPGGRRSKLRDLIPLYDLEKEDGKY